MAEHWPFHMPGLNGTRFQPSARLPPHEAERPTAWFAFQADRLLVRVQGDSVVLPEWGHLAALSASYERRHYLGRLGEVDCYAVELEAVVEPPADMALEGIRGLFGRLVDAHFSLAGRAVQVLEWDRNHRFCGRCGEPTVQVENERAKRCPRCGLHSYPRISPAVIMLVERGDRILLARNARNPAGFFSVLAGFVEPGESLEEAVVREVYEETAIEITDLRYFGSQPWPFPNSLMIGFTSTYAAGEIAVDGEEIAEAHWFEKRALPERLAGRISIARRLIDWAVEHRA
jgi:NAD+ diphosphatase